jgi:hypothetical protein
MPMRYFPAFRVLMIQKMTDPDGPSPISLADEIGVSRSSRQISRAENGIERSNPAVLEQR